MTMPDSYGKCTLSGCHTTDAPDCRSSSAEGVANLTQQAVEWWFPWSGRDCGAWCPRPITLPSCHQRRVRKR